MSWWFQPKTESSKLAGLKRSAFNAGIYRGLPIESYMPGIKQTFETLQILIRREPVTIRPKFYQVHDSFLMYYQPLDTVLSSLRRNLRNPTLWQKIISETVKSEDFMKLNRITSGSIDLAALAGARFYHHLVSEIGKHIQNMRWSQPDNEAIKQLANTPVGHILNMREDQLAQQLQQAAQNAGVGAQQAQQMAQQALQALKQILAPAAKAAAVAAMQDVKEYADLKQQGEALAMAIGGQGGHGFTHDAFSVMKYLRNPDEVRRRVKLLRDAIEMMKRFMNVLPTSLAHQQTVSVFGGISGVDRMLRESQLKDIIPSELAFLAVNNPELQKLLKLDFLLRLSQKQVMVYQRAATLKPVLFIDKSGSMAEHFHGSSIPKISAACGLALAIWMKYRGDVYFFDTELEGPISRRDVVRTLLTITADGGTRIEEALQEILRRGRKDEIYIIISDGIDQVSQETIDELKRRGLIKNVRFIIIPPSWEEAWLKNFVYVYARDIASFMDAARKMLSASR